MKVLYKIYSFCIAIPIFIVLTILVATTAAVASILGDDKGLGYQVPKWWGRISCWLFLLPVEVKGREYVDKKQSYVFLANHQSYFDIFLIYGYLGHNFKWMMKAYLKKIPFVGYACVKLKHVYVGDSISSIQKTVEQARETLQGGMSMVIFPEGTRTYTGQMGDFKRGAFMLANEIGLPIVPMTINGCYDVFSRTAKSVSRSKISLTIHKPITAEERQGKPTKVFMKDVFDIVNAGVEEKYRK